MIKYVEEFCEVDGYKCLMPVEYEVTEKGVGRNTYKKLKCVCHNVKKGNCKNGTTCSHFVAADEMVEE